MNAEISNHWRMSFLVMVKATSSHVAMWSGFGILLMMSNLCVVATQTCPAGNPGIPGIPGMPGHDGRDGEKGEKGEPGTPLQQSEMGTKGQKGERGPKGYPGKIGPSGVRGEPGGPGTLGPQGNMGDSGVYDSALQSAFSVARRTQANPPRNSIVKFTHAITNINGHFNTETGKFVCNIPGTYYFVYHASSQNSLCVLLKHEGNTLASFCDHKVNTYQASSGGLAVYLKKGESVWLETSDYNGMTAVSGKNSIFSGFLVYPH